MEKMNQEEIVKKVLELHNFKELNPVQLKSIEKGLFEMKNLVVSSPTSSGKTLITELAGLNVTLNQKKKMIYLSPLVALASEKYKEFKNLYSKLGIKVALSVGDFDSADPWLQNYDWVILSNEKMDSLVRHGAIWIAKIGLIVADEIHLLNDISRGPTLEILLTILNQICPQAQILALSATIKNAKEISQWLGAKVVFSNWRPVKLYYGLAQNEGIEMIGRKSYPLKDDFPIEEAILENTLAMEKQMIFFLSTRRSTEALAERLGKCVFNYLSDQEKAKLKKLAKEIEKTLETPTLQCQRLAHCLINGSAFFHAGLVPKQKELISEAYKNGLLKVLTSTTALAYGVNLPNFRAVVRDVKRYQPGIGSVYLPVLEVQQMFGRSGRPQFDEWGEGILIAKSPRALNELEARYIKGELERISSQINNLSTLRMYSLALIAAQFCTKKEELINFFGKTFFGFSYGSLIRSIEEKLIEVLGLLKEWEFIKSEEENLKATPLGKRISELYLDPSSAYQLIEGIKASQGIFQDFALLHLFCSTNEMKPGPSLTSKDLPRVELALEKNADSLLALVPDSDEEEYEEFLKEIKLALVFYSWIGEISEKEILADFNVAPGELYSWRRILDWLLYSLDEIGRILFLPKGFLSSIRILRKRVFYGVSKELFSLVKLEGIGRVRARALFKANFKKISDLKKADTEKIAGIIKNHSVAKRIKQQIKTLF